MLESQRRDIDAIGKLTVPSATGRPVRIDNIARLERGFGPTQLPDTTGSSRSISRPTSRPGHALDEASNDVRQMHGRA